MLTGSGSWLVRELIDEVKSRGATDLHLARTSFNDYFPLIRLKRQDEARGLLWAAIATVASASGGSTSRRDAPNSESSPTAICLSLPGTVLCSGARLTTDLGARQPGSPGWRRIRAVP